MPSGLEASRSSSFSVIPGCSRRHRTSACLALLTTRWLGDVLPDLEVVLGGTRRVVVEGVVLVVEGAVTLAVLLEAAGVDVEEDDFFPPHPAGTATLSTASMAAIPLLVAKRGHAFIGKAAYSADNDRNAAAARSRWETTSVPAMVCTAHAARP